MSLDNAFTTAVAILWRLVMKITLGSFLLPGVLIVCAIDAGLHLRLTTSHLWTLAMLTNLGLCGVWYSFFSLSTFLSVVQTQFFVGLLLALVSLFCHFGLQLEFFQMTFHRFSLFDFGM